MACLITLNLHHSVPDLEKASHPSHRSWKKSLQILRDIRNEECYYKWEISQIYFCVDEEHPNQVVFMYPRLDKKDFKTLQASLASTDTDTSSLLRDALTPLLKEPLSTTSAIQLSAALRLAYPQGPKCLEFLTARYPENETQHLDITLRFILTQYLTDFAPCTFVNPPLPPDTNPVMSFSNASADDGRTQFWCIEWRSLQDRHALFQSSGMRTVLKSSFPKDRIPIPEELGKSDGDLTGEEGFRPYFRSTGASEVRSRFLGAIIVTDEYLGLKEDQREDKRGKAGCQCIIL